MTFLLNDPRAGELCLRLLKQRDNDRYQMLAPRIIGSPDEKKVPSHIKNELTNILEGGIEAKPIVL